MFRYLFLRERQLIFPDHRQSSMLALTALNCRVRDGNGWTRCTRVLTASESRDCYLSFQYMTARTSNITKMISANGAGIGKNATAERTSRKPVSTQGFSAYYTKLMYKEINPHAMASSMQNAVPRVKKQILSAYNTTGRTASLKK